MTGTWNSREASTDREIPRSRFQTCFGGGSIAGAKKIPGVGTESFVRFASCQLNH